MERRTLPGANMRRGALWQGAIDRREGERSDCPAIPAGLRAIGACLRIEELPDAGKRRGVCFMRGLLLPAKRLAEQAAQAGAPAGGIAGQGGGVDR